MSLEARTERLTVVRADDHYFRPASQTAGYPVVPVPNGTPREIELFAYASEQRLPIFQYWHAGFQDLFLTHEWSELSHGFGSWEYLGILGYVESNGESPDVDRLYRWFNESEGIHRYTYESPGKFESDNQWTLETQNIYVPSITNAGQRPTEPESSSLSQKHEKVIASNLIDFTRIGPAEIQQKIEAAAGKNDSIIAFRGGVVSGDLTLNVSENCIIDLTGSIIEGNLTIAGGSISSMLISGLRVFGTLTLKDTQITRDVLADHVQVDGITTIRKVVAPDCSMFFDGASLNRFEVYSSEFKLLSLVRSRVAQSGSIRDCDIGSLIANRVSATNFVIRTTKITNFLRISAAAIRGHLTFELSECSGLFDLQSSICETAVHLGESSFRSPVRLDGLRSTSLDVHDSKFSSVLSGDIRIDEYVDFRNCVFESLVDLSGTVNLLVLDGARFDAETRLGFDGTKVSAVSSRFSQPTRLYGRTLPVRPIDFSNTDVSQLSVSLASLSRCIFSECVNLDYLNIDGTVVFDYSREFNSLRFRTLISRTCRPVVWDEVLSLSKVKSPTSARAREYVEAERLKSTQKAKSLFSMLPAPEIELDARVASEDLSSIYRSLRISLERRGRNSTANDLYYSEMVCTRRCSQGWHRRVYTAYWLVAGFGVRPLRPLLAFVTLIAILTGLDSRLHLFNFTNSSGKVLPDPNWVDALSHVLRTATSVLSVSGYTSDGIGGVLSDFAARIFLPALLAVFILNVRNLVKR